MSSNEAEAQNPCADCTSPKTCTYFTIDVPYCGYVTYYICYYCATTHQGTYVDIIWMSNICLGHEDEVWDAAYDWIFENIESLCGNQPCDQGSQTIYISYPTCGDAYWDGYYLQVEGNSNCANFCVTEWEWCWCNCTPDCIENTPCTPHKKITLIDSWKTGSDDCDSLPPTIPGLSWQSSESCVEIPTKCDE